MADTDRKSFKPAKKGFNFGGLDLEDEEEKKSPTRPERSPLKKMSSALGPARLPASADPAVQKQQEEQALAAIEAQQKLDRLNRMKIASGVEIDNAEVFGTSADRDLDALKNDFRSMEQQKLHQYSRGGGHIGKGEIVEDANVFEDAMDKFQKISDEQIVSDGQLKKSKQAIIAGKLLRI